MNQSKQPPLASIYRGTKVSSKGASILDNSLCLKKSTGNNLGFSIYSFLIIFGETNSLRGVKLTVINGSLPFVRTHK